MYWKSSSLQDGLTHVKLSYAFELRVEPVRDECRVPRKVKTAWFSGASCEPTDLWTYVSRIFRWVLSSFFDLLLHDQSPAKHHSPQYHQPRLLIPRLLIYSSQAMSCQGVSSFQGVTFLPSLAPQESTAAGCIQMTAPMECHRPPPWQQTLPIPSTSKCPDLFARLPETTLDTAPIFHSRPGMGW